MKRVAVIGNPNTGKSTLFNALTGFKRHVANYPGVTVELASGRVSEARSPIELIDLPGTYSLTAVSPDEQIVHDLLTGKLPQAARPDAILAIVDASNLTRNLYLVSQLLELGLPIVIALNMSDIAASRGYRIDRGELSQRLGVPVIEIVATRSDTLPPLVRALEQLDLQTAPARHRSLVVVGAGAPRPEASATGGVFVPVPAQAGPNPAEIRARYAWVTQLLSGVLSRPELPIVTWTDRIDSLLTHRVGGAAILIAVLAVMFQAIFAWAGPLMDWIDVGFGWLGGWVGGFLPEGALRSLVVDGLIAGVGGVLVFLPQILILFLFIAVLEDCGYMARAAFMMDRVMRVIGLSGRSLIPLLSAHACAIPAIMGTRSIADRRERFVTILIAPFMSCSARLPVYVVMIGAFVPATAWLGGWIGLQGLVMLAMYLVGIVVAIPIAWLLKRTAFSGPQPGFLLELPAYKLPGLRMIWQRMYLAGRSFVVRAGTVIVCVNLIVWALCYFPRNELTLASAVQQRELNGWDEAEFEKHLAGAYLRDSYLGRLGHAIEPAIRPLGWDWRIGISVLASFPAREVVIASLGTIFNLGADAGDDPAGLETTLQQAVNPITGRPLFTLPVALSIMVFFALCAQCSSTLVIMGREMRSVMWPVLSFVSMTTIAYVAAWVVAAGGRALGW